MNTYIMVHDHRAFHSLIANFYALWLWYEFYNILYINEGATLQLPAFIVPTRSRLLPSHARQRKLFLPPQPHHFVCCTRITTVVPKCLRLPLSAPSPGAQENLYITSTTRSYDTSRTPATSTLRVRDGTWETCVREWRSANFRVR